MWAVSQKGLHSYLSQDKCKDISRWKEPYSHLNKYSEEDNQDGGGDKNFFLWYKLLVNK